MAKPATSESAAELRKLLMPVLKEKCKSAAGLKVSGNKEELVARLTGAAPPPKPVKKVEGIPPHLLELLDPAKVKKDLKDHVKILAKMVDADWHDGFEEQSSELYEYVCNLEPHLFAVLALCTTAIKPPPPPAALLRVNDVLVEIAESWRDLEGVPFRCGLEESIEDVNATLDLTQADGDAMEGLCEGSDKELAKISRDEAMAVAWRTLLRAVASSPACDDAMLLRCIKDASEYDVEELVETNPPDGYFTQWSTEAGHARLQQALSAAGRSALAAVPSRVRQHKEYRLIDRRFDGAAHLRTRNFSSYGW